MLINTLTQRAQEMADAFNQGFGGVRGKVFTVSATAEPSWLEFKREFFPARPDGSFLTMDNTFDAFVLPLVREFAVELGDRTHFKYRPPVHVELDKDEETAHMIVEADLPFRVIVRQGNIWTGQYMFNEDADPKRVWVDQINGHAHEFEYMDGTEIIVDAYVKPEFEFIPTTDDDLSEPSDSMLADILG